MQIDKIESALKTWRRRARSAFNKVDKLERQLERQRRRMVSPAPAPKPAEQPSAKSPDPVTVESTVPVTEPAGLEIPPFLKRPVVDVAALKAERQAREAADKKKMPLTGRAAVAYATARPSRKRKAG